MNNEELPPVYPAMHVIILRGLPGSGKSFYARTAKKAVVVSADDYFVRNGEYVFVPAEIGLAHAQCFRRAINVLASLGCDPDIDTLIVDNTNTTTFEIAPYAAAAAAFGHTFEIVTVVCSVETSIRRNVHGTPAEVIQKMHENLMTGAMPPWWTCRTV